MSKLGLLFGDRKLESSAQLRDYNVKQGDTLFCVLSAANNKTAAKSNKSTIRIQVSQGACSGCRLVNWQVFEGHDPSHPREITRVLDPSETTAAVLKAPDTFSSALRADMFVVLSYRRVLSMSLVCQPAHSG